VERLDRLDQMVAGADRVVAVDDDPVKAEQPRRLRPVDRAAVTLAVENAARRLSSFPERSTQPAARVGHENAPVAPVSERRGD
jgi:hypothetical protein